MSKVDQVIEQLETRFDEFDEEEARKSAEELLEYDVPVDQVAQTLSRRITKSSDGGERVGRKKVIDVETEDRGLELEARVVDRVERSVTVRGEERDIVSGTLADETGTISFTSWRDFPFQEGDAVLIENATAREFRDETQVNVNEYTDLEPVEDSDLPGTEELTEASDVSVSEIRSVYRPRLTASIVDVQDRSGLIMRCPVEGCNRVTESNECREHGPVEPEPDLRIKAVLDDGTGSIQAVLNREVTEELTGITLEDAKEMAKDAMDRGVVQKEMEREVGRTVVAEGRVIGDMFVADYAEPAETDPEREASELMEVLQ